MENDKTQKGKVQITSVVMLLICMVDIYIIINVSRNYNILAAAMFVTFLFSILTVNSWVRWEELKKEYRDEQYSDIMKAEKGSYVVLQKKIQELDEKINFIGQKIMPLERAGEHSQSKIASILDSIVEDQKKIAKVTISRSKENADALMNSNDNLLTQMADFRNSIEDMQKQLLDNQGEMYGKEAQEISHSKDDLLGKITELSNLIEKVSQEISENIINSNAK